MGVGFMMKLLRFALLIGLGLLAACAPAAMTPTAAPDDSQVVGTEGGLYPLQDLALISSTGRPQFIHSYADWCITCQHNHPIVNNLKAEFGDQVDFINLNIDVPETLDARTRFDIVERSQYLLTDASGAVLQRWYGYLDEATVEAYVREYLTQQG